MRKKMVRGQLDDHGKDGFITITILVKNRSGFCHSEMKFVLLNQEMWRFNLELLQPKFSRKSGWKKIK